MAASALPMIHVIAMPGRWRCSVRTTGTTCVASPSADRRRMQTESGGEGTGRALLDWRG